MQHCKNKMIFLDCLRSEPNFVNFVPNSKLMGNSTSSIVILFLEKFLNMKDASKKRNQKPDSAIFVFFHKIQKSFIFLLKISANESITICRREGTIL